MKTAYFFVVVVVFAALIGWALFGRVASPGLPNLELSTEEASGIGDPSIPPIGGNRNVLVEARPFRAEAATEDPRRGGLGVTVKLVKAHGGVGVEGVRLIARPLAPYKHSDPDSYLLGSEEDVLIVVSGSDGKAFIGVERLPTSLVIDEPSFAAGSSTVLTESDLGRTKEVLLTSSSVATGRVLEADYLRPVVGAVLIATYKGVSDSALSLGRTAPSFQRHDPTKVRTAMTDGSGAYSLGGLLPDSKYDLVAAGPSHLAKEIQIETSPSGEHTELDDIFLLRGGRIELHVYSDTGPVSGALVSLEGQLGGVDRGYSGRKTSKEGVASFSGVPRGASKLLIVHKDYPRTELTAFLEGNEDQVVISESLSGGNTFVVIAIDDVTDSPVPGVEVILQAGAERRRGQSDSSGRIEFPHVSLPRATIIATAGGFARNTLVGATSSEPIVLRMTVGQDLNGRLAGIEDSSADTWMVGIATTNHSASIPPQGVSCFQRTNVDKDQVFRFHDVALGEYTILAWSDTGEFFSSRLTFTDPANQLVVSPAGPLRIQGRVLDMDSGAPLKGVRVVYLGIDSILSSNPVAERGAYSSVTSLDGTFDLPCLDDQLGEYLVDLPGYSPATFGVSNSSVIRIARIGD